MNEKLLQHITHNARAKERFRVGKVVGFRPEPDVLEMLQQIWDEQPLMSPTAICNAVMRAGLKSFGIHSRANGKHKGAAVVGKAA